MCLAWSADPPPRLNSWPAQAAASSELAKVLGSAPRRRVVALEDAPRFEATDPALCDFFEAQGFAIVRDACGPAELSTLRELLWAHLGEACGMVRGDPDTWRSRYDGPAHLGLFTWGHTGQSALMWHARRLAAVGAAFETCWRLPGGAPMLVSFDGAAVFRPPQLESSWATQPALGWLHVDQGATKRGLAGIQGQLLLWDQVRSCGMELTDSTH